jgi:outer membrane protein assembly factor BamB
MSRTHSVKELLMSCARILTLVSLAFLTLAALADGATGWRGDGTGRFPGATVPTAWGKDTNVVWKAAVPTWSNAAPIALGTNLFLTAEPNLLVCLNAADGAVRWQKPFTYFDTLTPEKAEKVRAASKLFERYTGLTNQLKREPGKLELYTQLAELCTQLAADKDNAELLRLADSFKTPETHGDNGYASATPTTDGKLVFVVNGTGLVAAFDAEGTRKWTVFPAKPQQGWGHSASPLVVAGKLLVQIENAVYALDPATGATLWRADVSNQSWGTAAATKIGGVDVAIYPCGDILRVADGKRLARRIAGLNYNGPVVANGIVYFIDGERGSVAYKLPTEAADELKLEKAWDAKIAGNRYYASPLVHDGLIYAMNQAQHLNVLDAADGKVLYEQDLKLGGTGYPSPVLAGNVVIVSSDSGNAVVLQPGREYKELGRNSLEFFRGNPLCIGTRMYLHARGALYCIGK